ncbi:MAG: response regulator transcription factor [Bacilli bacterium]|nr:response regulator transcription factor [Bacilli bacterium]
MNVLIIDDELLIRDVVKEYCLNEGFKVLEAANGIEGLEILDKEKVDIIVLDIMMPKMDGYTFFSKMKEKYNIPTIVLSARGEEYDKLFGFSIGIDDYLTKPFSPKELIARIKAILKRFTKEEIDEFTYLGIKIDFKGRVLYIDNEEIQITPKEFDLLKYFIENPNTAISREQILNKVWGYDYFGDDRTIDTHIKILRNKLGPYRDSIVTVRSIGYKFIYEKA